MTLPTAQCLTIIYYLYFVKLLRNRRCYHCYNYVIFTIFFWQAIIIHILSDKRQMVCKLKVKKGTF